MLTELQKKNLTSVQFKKRYPRLFKKIIGMYTKILDTDAVICMYLRSESQPVCDFCCKTLRITKNFRYPVESPRCSTHVNSTWVTTEDLQAANKEGYVLSIPAGRIMSSDKIIATCPSHGSFSCVAANFLDGQKCRRCSDIKNSLKARKTTAEFISQAKIVHSGKYDYCKTKYTTTKAKVTIVCPVHGDFEQGACYHLGGNGCPACAMSSSRSSHEYQIIEFLKNLGITNIEHGWKALGREMDIYLPDYATAIEFNGIYWHSSNDIKNDENMSKKHLLKTNLCENNGIKLFHIMDTEWINPVKKEIWLSILTKVAGKTDAIQASDCTVSYTDTTTARNFFNVNHLGGYAPGSVYLALSHNKKIVCMAALLRRKNSYELVRYAEALNITVIDGLDAILGEFYEVAGDTVAVTACIDRRWDHGLFYISGKFKHTKYTEPNFYYVDKNSSIVHTSSEKKSIKSKITTYDPTMSSVQNMYANGYRRYWDCGYRVLTRLGK